MDKVIEPRCLPSIDVGNDVRIGNIDTSNHIIIQEKIDGSQFTITKQNGVLHFYNKNKEVSPKRGPWLSTFLSLQGKENLFKESFFYHGEAMTSRQTNIAIYQRVPSYFWVIYEIVRPDNSILTPDEMAEVLKGTNFETVQIFYDNRKLAKEFEGMKLQQIIDSIMVKIEQKQIESCLGNTPEGIVVKVLNVPNKGKISNTRYKYVKEEFCEERKVKRDRLPEVPDDQFIIELGRIFDVDARRHKAVQHLKEQGNWQDENPIQNIKAMEDELDKDLLKERADDIKYMLLARFWKVISNAAKGDIKGFLQTGQQEDPKDDLPVTSDEQFIIQLGKLYDTPQRKHKIIQQLKDQGKWKKDITKDIQSVAEELENDLLKEHGENIKIRLMNRFWKTIHVVARGNIQEFIKEL